MSKFDDYESMSSEEKAQYRTKIEEDQYNSYLQEEETKKEIRRNRLLSIKKKKNIRKLIYIYIPVVVTITLSVMLGRVIGYNTGHDSVYDAVYTDVFDLASSDGYDDGYAAGETEGYEDGESDGFTAGYDDGEGDGYVAGYNIGNDAGYNAGYDLGLIDGESDGYNAGLAQATTEIEETEYNLARESIVFNYITANEESLINRMINDGYTCTEVSCKKQTSYTSDDVQQWDYYEIGSFILERKAYYETDAGDLNHQIVSTNLLNGTSYMDWGSRSEPINGFNRIYDYYLDEYECFGTTCEQEDIDTFFDWFTDSVNLLEQANMDWILYLEKK